MQHSLRVLAFIFSYLLPYPKLMAGPHYSWDIQPLKIIPTKEDTLSISYQEVCGSTFRRIVLRSTAEGGLRLGILTRRSHTRCSQLSGMQTMKIPYIQKSQFTSIAAMAPTEEPSQLKIAPVQNGFTKQAGSESELYVPFTSNCGKQVGLFLRPEATGLRLGMVEGIKDDNTHCTRKTEVYSIKNLSLPEDTQLLLDPIEDENKFTPYILKRIPVDIGEAKVKGKEKKFSLFFNRACNESPIGLVREQKDSRQISLSMLVAQYPKSMCPVEVRRIIRSQWEDGFTTSLFTQVRSAVIPKSETALRVTRPLSYQWSIHEGHRSLQLTSFNFCLRNVGIVSRSFAQGLAVGILQNSKAKSCNSSLEKVSYAYEWDRTTGVDTDVKPLQLLGSH